MSRLDGDIHVGGLLTADNMRVPAGAVSNTSIAADAAILRTKLALESLKGFPVPPWAWRVWDAMHTNLPGTSSGDDLALAGGTFGTAGYTLRTENVSSTGADKTYYARVVLPVPLEYVAGENLYLRCKGGAIGAIADTTCSVDFSAYQLDKEGGLDSGDLVLTSAQTMNSLTFAFKSFQLQASAITAADLLDVRVALLMRDNATGGSVVGALGDVELLCDIRG